MEESGFHVSGQQCNTKWKGLKLKYEDILTKNNRSGSGRNCWEFFEVLKYLTSTRGRPNPVLLNFGQNRIYPSQMLAIAI